MIDTTELRKAAENCNVPTYDPRRTPEEVDRLRKCWDRYRDVSRPATILALLDEREKLLKVAEAAKNLVDVKGRHHTEQAFVRLQDELKELEK